MSRGAIIAPGVRPGRRCGRGASGRVDTAAEARFLQRDAYRTARHQSIRGQAPSAALRWPVERARRLSAGATCRTCCGSTASRLRSCSPFRVGCRRTSGRGRRSRPGASDRAVRRPGEVDAALGVRIGRRRDVRARAPRRREPAVGEQARRVALARPPRGRHPLPIAASTAPPPQTRAEALAAGHVLAAAPAAAARADRAAARRAAHRRALGEPRRALLDRARDRGRLPRARGRDQRGRAAAARRAAAADRARVRRSARASSGCTRSRRPASSLVGQERRLRARDAGRARARRRASPPLSAIEYRLADVALDRAARAAAARARARR